MEYREEGVEFVWDGNSNKFYSVSSSIQSIPSSLIHPPLTSSNITDTTTHPPSSSSLSSSNCMNDRVEYVHWIEKEVKLEELDPLMIEELRKWKERENIGKIIHGIFNKKSKECIVIDFLSLQHYPYSQRLSSLSHSSLSSSSPSSNESCLYIRKDSMYRDRDSFLLYPVSCIHSFHYHA